MGKLPKAFIPAFCFLLLTPCIFAGKKELTVRIWLFQGTSVEGQAALSQVEIIPLSSSPALSAAKSLAGGPENDFKSAVIEALLDMKGLKTIDDLFLSKLRQTEDLPFPDKSVLGKQMAYRIDLSYKVLSPTLMGLRVVLSKTKEGVVPQGKGDRQMLRDAYNATRDMDKMDNIVDQELTLGFDNPVIVGIPNQRRPYFMVVKLTANEPAPKRRTMPMIKMPPVVNLIPAPQPLDKVLPIYPDELRRRGIKGDVGLRIAINEKGIVRMVQVLASLNPYLDYSGSQALWLWKFEPVLKNGKPVPAVFDYTFNFDPRAYSEGMTYVEGGPTAMDETSREELRRILGECAEYCRKLADVALSYICEETIKETTYALVSEDRLAEVIQRPGAYAVQVYESSDGRATGWIVDRPQIMSSRNVDRLIYDCDYQLIRKFGDIEERRIVLKENGRKITDRVELLEEDRYSVLSPIVSSLKILDKEHQPLFNYRILKEDKVYGRNAYVLEALPKFGDADGVRSARAWVDKERFQIIKVEVEGVPLDGYDDVLRDAVLLNIKPLFLRTYEFQPEKNGVLFPDRTTVRVEYPSPMPNGHETKSKIELTYKDFKFFTVETSHEIKK